MDRQRTGHVRMIVEKFRPNTLAVAAAVAASLLVSLASAKTSHDEATRTVDPPPASPQTHRHSPYHLSTVSSHATNYYRAAWGVDNLEVRRTASGNLVRFTYRVTDAERAKVLGQKEATPHLIAPQRGVILQVPVMEKIGQLRQTGTPEVGREYWMVFSNKGDVVKVGDRVDVVIGSFHADGLVVE